MRLMAICHVVFVSLPALSAVWWDVCDACDEWDI